MNTPPIVNIAPNTGRMLPESGVAVNVIDGFGYVKVLQSSNASVHDGKMFEHSSGNSLASGLSASLLFITGSKEVHMLNNYLKADNNPVRIEFYENCIVSANGVLLPSVNKNRNSATVAESMVYGGPTVTSQGTQLSVDAIFGGNKAGGASEQVAEWLLKPNTKYLFKVTNQAAQTLNYVGGFDWSEHNPAA